MPLFRKKPVEIEAMQFLGPNFYDCMQFCGGNFRIADDGKEVMTIRTLEGVMLVSAGDWIIKGVAGEFYPCKPDIFERTYESSQETK